MSDTDALPENWWMPLEGSDPCGPNLEYDPDFIALVEAAAGRPETLFGPGQPADWLQVRALAEALMPRTRDLRIAALWGRAAVARHGLDELPRALHLLARLLEQCWDHLHPQPDEEDADAVVRLGPLIEIDAPKGLLGDLRHAALTTDRRLPNLRLRDIEVALERLAPRELDEPLTAEQIRRAFAEVPEVAQALVLKVAEAQAALNALRDAMAARFGAAQPVQLKALRQMMGDLQGLLPAAAAPGATDGQELHEEERPATEPVRGAADGAPQGLSIETRADAIRVLRQVRAFLERTEPTNPAQLMLRRAERVIDKDFFELVREIAPGGLLDAARILGLDAEAPVD
ncbi:type VI secretion system protein TssA [Eleftheria terrae]|uniref:type VI secretion system protein TssA n=1 Tax=Eleftheria terrae TaxID=1597781 RepID=UPI00263A70E2|nr:type VI secretion system protein TssA [Eleftheria terrae]WKB55670.1 type VI secretion system protein TssA [Eleftheria terrae]